jgi:hypothetical protein
VDKRKRPTLQRQPHEPLKKWQVKQADSGMLLRSVKKYPVFVSNFLFFRKSPRISSILLCPSSRPTSSSVWPTTPMKRATTRAHTTRSGTGFTNFPKFLIRILLSFYKVAQAPRRTLVGLYQHIPTKSVGESGPRERDHQNFYLDGVSGAELEFGKDSQSVSKILFVCPCQPHEALNFIEVSVNSN